MRKGESLRGGLEVVGSGRLLALLLLGGVPGDLPEAGGESVAGGGVESGALGAGTMMGAAASFLLRRKRWMCFSMVARGSVRVSGRGGEVEMCRDRGGEARDEGKVTRLTALISVSDRGLPFADSGPMRRR